MVTQPNEKEYLNAFDVGGLANSLISGAGSYFSSKNQADAAQSQADAAKANALAAQANLEAMRIAANKDVSGGDPNKGLSTGAIVGIVAGGIAVVGLIVVLAVRK